MKIKKTTTYDISFDWISEYEYLVLVKALMNSWFIETEVVRFWMNEWDKNILNDDVLTKKYESLDKK